VSLVSIEDGNPEIGIERCEGDIGTDAGSSDD
jgi:hypothetical protein